MKSSNIDIVKIKFERQTGASCVIGSFYPYQSLTSLESFKTKNGAKHGEIDFGHFHVSGHCLGLIDSLPPLAYLSTRAQLKIQYHRRLFLRGCLYRRLLSRHDAGH